MDDRGFDEIARALAGGATRRTLFKLLAGAAGVVGVAGRRAADAFVCRQPGATCLKDAQCCSNICDPKDFRCACPAGTIPCGTRCIPSCAPLDQCHDAGVCDPATGTCTNPVKTDGAACDDGNACTRTDTCRGGVCVGGNPVACTALDQCHVAGTCDPTSGACSNPARPDGTSCDDGNACTQTDTCQGGVCVGGNPVVCSALDQCHSIGVCDPATGQCSNPSKPDGTSCDDGNACTHGDSCQGGVCAGGAAVVCTASDQCHAAGTCNPATGLCSNPAKADGTSCNDGDACTQTDTCQGGVCVGGNPVVCPTPIPSQCHLAGICDPTSGICSNPNKPNGTICVVGALVGECTNGQCRNPCPGGAAFCVSTGNNPTCCGANSACAEGGVGGNSVCCPTGGGTCTFCGTSQIVCCTTDNPEHNTCACCTANQTCHNGHCSG